MRTARETHPASVPMGRWIESVRERQPRDWMLPGVTPAEEGLDTPDAPVATATEESRYRTPWARGPRAPLRRNHGVPAPLETPLYLHRAELGRARARRRTSALAVAILCLALAAALAALRALLPIQ